jgi:Mrp family chromosome partitioning ATPase
VWGLLQSLIQHEWGSPEWQGWRSELASATLVEMAQEAGSPQPILMLISGLPGSGKSTVADQAAALLGAPVLAHDWAMSGLRPLVAVQSALGARLDLP